MNDLFKRTMVVCAAIGTFGVGAMTIYSGTEVNLREKIEATVAAREAKLDQMVKSVSQDVDNAKQ